MNEREYKNKGELTKSHYVNISIVTTRIIKFVSSVIHYLLILELDHFSVRDKAPTSSLADHTPVAYSRAN